MRRWSLLPLELAHRFRQLRASAIAAVLARRHGQGLVEYGLILTLIAVVVVGIMTLLGQTVSGLWYQRIIDGINSVIP
jgi:pilus assembly protein Flp/PilA